MSTRDVGYSHYFRMQQQNGWP